MSTPYMDMTHTLPPGTLLPCPFCSRPAFAAKGMLGYKVECSGRHAVHPVQSRPTDCPVNMRTHYRSTLEEAVALWNKRGKK